MSEVKRYTAMLQPWRTVHGWPLADPWPHEVVLAEDFDTQQALLEGAWGSLREHMARIRELEAERDALKGKLRAIQLEAEGCGSQVSKEFLRLGINSIANLARAALPPAPEERGMSWWGWLCIGFLLGYLVGIAPYLWWRFVDDGYRWW